MEEPVDIMDRTWTLLDWTAGRGIVFVDDKDREETRRRRRSLSWGQNVSVVVALLICGLAWSLVRWPEKPPPQRTTSESTESSVLVTAALRLRPRGKAKVSDFVMGTEALNPVFDRFGLARFVAVNLDKIRALPDIHRDPDLEALLLEDAETGNGVRDDSATVAVLWNARVLHFLAAMIDGIIAEDNVLDPHSDAEVSLATVARRAYEDTLQRYHSGILRSAARARLAFAPDRIALFNDRLGYPPHLWSSRFKSDLHDLSSALHSLLNHLRHAFDQFHTHI